MGDKFHFISAIKSERRGYQRLKRSRFLYIIPVIIGIMILILFTGFSKKGENEVRIQTEDVESSRLLGIDFLINPPNQRIYGSANDDSKLEDKSLRNNKDASEAEHKFFNELTRILKERPAGVERLIKDKEESINLADKGIEENSKQAPSSESESEKNNKPIKLKRVALTFDDGPHPKNTEKILLLLEKYDAKATFFMLGSNVDYYPGIAKSVTEAGHELGNHTWSHRDLTTLGSDSVAQEAQDTNEIIKKATGEEPTVFRPPYGATNEQVETAVKMVPVLWTVDTMDWKSGDPNAILEIVKRNVEDGSIILLHDIHDSTVVALEPILNFLDEEGYNFVTVSDLEKY